jgi:protein-disulfide isomerase
VKNTILSFIFLIVALFVLGCAPQEVSSQSEGEVAALSSDNAALASSASNLEAGLAGGSYEGLPIGFTDEGFPFIGDPDAPVTLEEYSDFLCPYCGRHFSQTMPQLMEQYIKTGQVKYVFRDMPLTGLHPTAPAGHIAARCVAEQGAEFFWQMHDQLFVNQNGWNRSFDPSEYIAEMAESIGVDMEDYQSCIEDGSQAAFVEASTTAGRELGFNGTPSFQVLAGGGSDETYRLVGALPLATFSSYIDALLAGEKPAEPEPPEEQAAELPYWASEEGLQPDPERPGYTLAGDQYKGDPGAAVVVIEFADFQCPACAQHALDIQPALDEAYVDSGQVMWVFKHFPLRIHPQAALAAAAAECAADQGQFWIMHDLLFEKQAEWGQETPEPDLSGYAGQLGLDVLLFETCLEGRGALERVLADLYDGQGVINTTPNFVIIAEGRGRLLQSSYPADQFGRILDGYLEAAVTE